MKLVAFDPLAFDDKRAYLYRIFSKYVSHDSLAYWNTVLMPMAAKAQHTSGPVALVVGGSSYTGDRTACPQPQSQRGYCRVGWLTQPSLRPEPKEPQTRWKVLARHPADARDHPHEND